MDKEKIRPIYSELQGYLSQAPLATERNFMGDSAVWEQYHHTLDELKDITGEDYSRFKVHPRPLDYHRGTYVEVQTYRTNLGGLISRLHGKHFSDEPPPFSGMPSTVITQQQTQSQNVQVQILLEVQSKIDELIPTVTPGSKERTFLEQLKSSLAGVKNTVDLVRLILNTGKATGVTLAEILKLFS